MGNTKYKKGILRRGTKKYALGESLDKPKEETNILKSQKAQQQNAANQTEFGKTASAYSPGYMGKASSGNATSDTLYNTGMTAVSSSGPVGSVVGTASSVGHSIFDPIVSDSQAIDPETGGYADMGETIASGTGVALADPYANATTVALDKDSSVGNRLLAGLGWTEGYYKDKDAAMKKRFKEAKEQNEVQAAPKEATNFNMPTFETYANGGELIKFTGNRHENGGIMIGDSNNEVEGKETMNENYVFSDRLMVPGYKSTFANKSKSIESKYKLRPNDKLSTEAKQRELDVLKQLNSQVKLETEAKSLAKFDKNNPGILNSLTGTEEFSKGGLLNYNKVKGRPETVSITTKINTGKSDAIHKYMRLLTETAHRKFPDGGSIKKQPTDYYNTNRGAYADSVITANKDKEWAQRLINKDTISIQNPNNPSERSSILMADNGQGYVYPTLTVENKKLKKLPENEDQAEAYARSHNLGIQLPKEKGSWFAANGYKTGNIWKNYSKTYADGGELNPNEPTKTINPYVSTETTEVKDALPIPYFNTNELLQPSGPAGDYVPLTEEDKTIAACGGKLKYACGGKRKFEDGGTTEYGDKLYRDAVYGNYGSINKIPNVYNEDAINTTNMIAGLEPKDTIAPSNENIKPMTMDYGLDDKNDKQQIQDSPPLMRKSSAAGMGIQGAGLLASGLLLAKRNKYMPAKYEAQSKINTPINFERLTANEPLRQADIAYAGNKDAVRKGALSSGQLMSNLGSVTKSEAATKAGIVEDIQNRNAGIQQAETMAKYGKDVQNSAIELNNIRHKFEVGEINQREYDQQTKNWLNYIDDVSNIGAGMSKDVTAYNIQKDLIDSGVLDTEDYKTTYKDGKYVRVNKKTGKVVNV